MQWLHPWREGASPLRQVEAGRESKTKSSVGAHQKDWRTTRSGSTFAWKRGDTGIHCLRKCRRLHGLCIPALVNTSWSFISEFEPPSTFQSFFLPLLTWCSEPLQGAVPQFLNSEMVCEWVPLRWTSRLYTFVSWGSVVVLSLDRSARDVGSLGDESCSWSWEEKFEDFALFC